MTEQEASIGMASLAADPAISHSVKGQAEPQTVMMYKDPFV